MQHRSTAARARQIIEAYKQRGVEPERVIKLASTWQGLRAAQILQSEGVKCNMTLLLNRAQAIASADTGAKTSST
jgi:transaldolase